MVIVQTMNLEFLGEVSIYFGIGVQVVVALVLGGFVGYDREKKLKTAGIKTNILICLGATLYTSVGLLLSVGSAGIADPNRVAAQIVSGIGFLGAGAILHGRGSVVGMTTAATIWVVAAIGFTIGAGYPFTATIFATTVLVVLKMIGPVYKFLENEKEYNYFQLDVLSKGSILQTVKGIIEYNDVVIDDYLEESFEGKKITKILSVFMLAHPRHMEKIVHDLRHVIRVQEAAYYPVARTARLSQESKIIVGPETPP